MLLWGGRDTAGATLAGGEIFDPQHDRFSVVSVAPTVPLSGEAPELAGTIPPDGADGVALDPVLALRFSKPLQVESVTPATASLQCVLRAGHQWIVRRDKYQRALLRDDEGRNLDTPFGP